MTEWIRRANADRTGVGRPGRVNVFDTALLQTSVASRWSGSDRSNDTVDYRRHRSHDDMVTSLQLSIETTWYWSVAETKHCRSSSDQ